VKQLDWNAELQSLYKHPHCYDQMRFLTAVFTICFKLSCKWMDKMQAFSVFSSKWWWCMTQVFCSFCFITVLLVQLDHPLLFIVCHISVHSSS